MVPSSSSGSRSNGYGRSRYRYYRKGILVVVLLPTYVVSNQNISKFFLNFVINSIEIKSRPNVIIIQEGIYCCERIGFAVRLRLRNYVLNWDGISQLYLQIEGGRPDPIVYL